MNFIQINLLTFDYKYRTIYFLLVRNRFLTREMRNREFKFRSEQSLFFSFNNKEKVKAKRDLTTEKNFDERNDLKKFEREKFQRRKRSEKISTMKINFLFSFKFC